MRLALDLQCLKKIYKVLGKNDRKMQKPVNINNLLIKVYVIILCFVEMIIFITYK